MPKVSSWDFVHDDALSSFAPLTSEVMRSICGRTRNLHELASGEVTGRQCTPNNPQGLVGVDLSGPPWGSAIRHSVANAGSYFDSTLVQSSARNASGIMGSTSTFWRSPMRVWVRPFETVPGAPYSQLSMSLHASNSAAGTANYEVRFIDTATLASIRTVTVNITGTTVATYALSGFFLDAAPGWNAYVIEIKKTGGTGTATVHALTLFNDSKRGH